MSDQSRALPDRPSLRYLRLEAKRRLAAGEFTTLHRAQLTIAREHGLSSWAALKHHVEAGTTQALVQVRWMVSRFATADAPGWTPPDEDELRRHFDDHYLRLVPPDWLARLFGALAARLREGLADVRVEPLRLRARVGDLRVEAVTETDPPHRLRQLRFYPVRTAVEDPRVAAPPAHTSGAVPLDAAAVAEDSFAGLGLVGLIVAGATGSSTPTGRSRSTPSPSGWPDRPPERTVRGAGAGRPPHVPARGRRPAQVDEREPQIGPVPAARLREGLARHHRTPLSRSWSPPRRRSTASASLVA